MWCGGWELALPGLGEEVAGVFFILRGSPRRLGSQEWTQALQPCQGWLRGKAALRSGIWSWGFAGYLRVGQMDREGLGSVPWNSVAGT